MTFITVGIRGRLVREARVLRAPGGPVTLEIVRQFFSAQKRGWSHTALASCGRGKPLGKPRLLPPSQWQALVSRSCWTIVKQGSSLSAVLPTRANVNFT